MYFIRLEKLIKCYKLTDSGLWLAVEGQSVKEKKSPKVNSERRVSYRLFFLTELRQSRCRLFERCFERVP